MRPIFFMHIAKTAGSSVNAVFQKHFGDRALVHAEGNRLGWKQDQSRFDYISGHVRLDEYLNCVSGPSFTFTMLRDPVAHLRSHLNWIRIQRQQERFAGFLAKHQNIATISDALQSVSLSDPWAIRRFLDSTPTSWSFFDNGQSRYFRSATGKFGVAELGDAVKCFSRFDLVAMADDLENMILALSKRLGLPLDPHITRHNVETYDKDVDRGLFREVLAPYLRYDCVLYELAQGA